MSDDKKKLVRNERVRLTATLVNTSAAGVVVSGVVAQIAPVLYGSAIPRSPLWSLVALSAVVLACCLHLVARWIVGDLNP